jgi:hypothetical protein
MIRHPATGAAIAGFALLLAGCAGPAIPRATPPRTAGTRPAPPPVAPPRVVQHNSLIGHDADAAIGVFGKPRLDVTEGVGRKLQFAGDACILDVYYYAPKQGAKPLATHVDARAPDGRVVGIDGCIVALQR